ncbi:MAG: doxx family protein [Bacteroidota bacterium]
MVKKIILGIRERLAPNMLTLSIGLVYLWFGSLKFFPSMSPAEDLAKNTIHQLTFGFLSDGVAINLLAIWEVTVGLLLILNLWLRKVALVALLHMIFTFTPLVFFPLDSFQEPPWVPTLLGQYIGKNLIIVAALLTLLKEDYRNK